MNSAEAGVTSTRRRKSSS